ncbi:MAG: PilC/PilY family type IV pilus protein, partial [Gammaproteobacteria bacterium]
MTTRKIYTFNGTSKIELKTTGDLSASQKSDLLTGKPAAATDTDYLSSIVKFIYGDHADEVGNGGLEYFRDRGNNRLGDIVHSAPVYVGAPNASYPDSLETSLYSTFKSDNSGRKGTVFVGSNDGMLHAFNADNGTEQFAYIPSMLFSSSANKGLHYYASQLYEHQYYVDLTPTVADVYVGANWKTMLVGGVRGGGKGIFALDITTAGSPTLQFEFTHNDLGYTFSEIQVAKM